MDLADTIYDYKKYNTTLSELIPTIQDELLTPLSNISSSVNNLNFEGINSAFESKSSLESCDLPHCKSINMLDDLLKCEGPVCNKLKSSANWIKNGVPPSGQCNDPLCSISLEIDKMIKNPKDCDNPFCNLIRRITGEDFLSNILMEILNFILGPFKGPFTTLVTAILLIVVGMFLVLVYLIFFK